MSFGERYGTQEASVKQAIFSLRGEEAWHTFLTFNHDFNGYEKEFASDPMTFGVLHEKPLLILEWITAAF